MKEEWKVYKITPINKYNHKGGIYEVSNKGNVKLNGYEYFPTLQCNGYYKIGGDGSLHRAVAELFIPNPENKPCVDHIDGNTLNNNVENLRWTTYIENNNNPITKKRFKEAARRRNYIPSLNFIYSNKGKHKVYDDKERNIYHYE